MESAYNRCNNLIEAIDSFHEVDEGFKVAKNKCIIKSP